MSDASQKLLLIHTLGDVYLAGHNFDLRVDIPPQIQALFIYLAMQKMPTSHAVLADLFWPTLNYELAQARLQQLLYDSNRFLAPSLQFERGAVGLNPNVQYQVDALLFQQCASELLQQMHQAAARSVQQIPNLQSTLRLYRGIFLATLTPLPSARYEEWARQVRIQIHQVARQSFDTLQAHWLEKQDLPRAIAQLRGWLRAVPYDDAEHAELMVLLGQLGQYGEAIEHYELYRMKLAQLGKRPSDHLYSLYVQFSKGHRS